MPWLTQRLVHGSQEKYYNTNYIMSSNKIELKNVETNLTSDIFKIIRSYDFLKY